MSDGLEIKQVTKQVEKTVLVDEVVALNITLAEPKFRRVGRVLLAYDKGEKAYVGPRTKAAIHEFVEAAGFTEENTRPR